MSHIDRHRRSSTPFVEGLESRRLLSAGRASVVSAEFSIPSGLIPAIKGTIYATITSISQLSPTTELVDYTAQGKATIIGDGKGYGQTEVVRKLLKNGSTNDTYKNGSATILGNTDTVAIHYSGTGHTNAAGNWTATWKGTAKSVAGEHAGLSGSFSAKLSGSNQSGTFTVNLTIKV